MVNVVLLFHCIFNEDDMTFDVVGNIVYQSHVVSSMKGECPIETRMSAKSFAVRLMNCTNHVEMDSISTDFEGLSDVS